MTTLPDLRPLAVQTLSCRTCKQPAGQGCRTAKGAATGTHKARVDDLGIWLSRQPEIDQLLARATAAETTVSALQAQVLGLQNERLGFQAQIRDLKAQLADLSPWQRFHTVDVHRQEDGWKINTGGRPDVDSSLGRAEMVTFTPDGILLTAQRSGAQILSCDIISPFALPKGPHWAAEIEVQFGGYLGVGMFPCPAWFKGIRKAGQTTEPAGELDGVEFMGGRLGNPGLDGKMAWKMTAISLMPQASQLVQAQEQLLDFITDRKLDWYALHTWRWEKTDGRFEVFIDGEAAAAITREKFDAAKGSSKGLWDKNFESPDVDWYSRHTWQVGPPSNTKVKSSSAGPVPADWTRSTMLIPRYETYQLAA